MTGTDLDLFAGAGDGLEPEHFGIDEHGRAYVVAPVFAKAMGYASTQKATDLVDSEEKGHEDIVTRSTSGVEQVRRVVVIYEDGIWELIFRSTLPSAKSIKARVKAILRELRETGVVDTRPPLAEISHREFALRILAEADRADAAEQKARELEPAANSWTQLAEASGDYSLREAAQILDRDPAISTGQNRLSAKLRELGWTDRSGTPYQRHVDVGRLLLRTYTDRQDVARSQVRITAKGLGDLHRLLGGTGAVLLEVAS